VFLHGKLHTLSTDVYILMAGVHCPIRLCCDLALPGFLGAGRRLFYTLGVAFFASRRKYSHTIWHCLSWRAASAISLPYTVTFCRDQRESVLVYDDNKSRPKHARSDGLGDAG